MFCSTGRSRGADTDTETSGSILRRKTARLAQGVAPHLTLCVLYNLARTSDIGLT